VINNPMIAGPFKTQWQLAFKNENGETFIIGKPIEFILNIESVKAKGADEKIKQEIVMTDAEKLAKYPEKVRKSAMEMKKIFPQADVAQLAEFIGQSPDLSLDELVENYLH